MNKLFALIFALCIAILTGFTECSFDSVDQSLDGMDIPAYNNQISARNIALNEIWAYFQKDLYRQTNETLPGYITEYRSRASAVVDQFDIAICGSPAAGGLLLKARESVLAGYDEYLTLNPQSLSPRLPAKSL